MGQPLISQGASEKVWMLDQSKEVVVVVGSRDVVDVVESGKRAKKKKNKDESAEGVLWTRKEWRNPDGRNKEQRKECRPSKPTTTRSKLEQIEIGDGGGVSGRSVSQERGGEFHSYP